MVFYILVLIIISFGAYKVYDIDKTGGNKQGNLDQVKIILYDSVNTITELYKYKQMDKDIFVNEVIALARQKICDNLNLSEFDKQFWTSEKLQNLFRPIIISMMDKIDQRLTKG